MNLERTLADLEFLETHTVNGQASISNLFLPEKRCGIYVLHFANDEVYAGQAIDVCRRYGQHRKNYDDIVKLSFKCVTPDKLNKEEKRVIQSLEKMAFHLRNIVHTSVTYAPSPFDELMLPEDQNTWLNDMSYSDIVGKRINDPDLRRKYSAKFQRFLGMPYATEIIEVLGQYVQSCIPASVLAEKNYWSCSCLMEKLPNDLTIYSRININRQAVFHARTDHGVPFFSWHLASSPFSTSIRKRIHIYQRYWKFRLLPTNERYVPGGQDQFTVSTIGENAIQDALNTIRDSDFLQAIRMFNLGLIRKGPNLNYKSHCFDLADRLFQ